MCLFFRCTIINVEMHFAFDILVGDELSRLMEHLLVLLDELRQKLTEIIRQNNIKSVTIVRMEVPCCGGIENAAKRALQASGKFIPWQVVTVRTDGSLVRN